MRYIIPLFFCLTLYAAPVDRLIEGNLRFVSGELEHQDRSAERRKEVAVAQAPFAIIVSCSDSRVAPEIIFDQGIGDLFVVRTAGNVIGTLEQESIDYAALVLKSSVIVVMGHAKCGAVDAVLKKQADLIPNIAKLIDPAAKLFPYNLEKAIKQNALNMSKNVQTAPSLSKLIEEKKLEVYPAYYDLKSGRVEFLSLYTQATIK